MNFPPGYRDLRSFRAFARLSGLAHPIENIFTLHSEIQISKGDTFTAKDDEAFLDLLCVTEEGIEGATIKNALLRSGMVEETDTPGVYFANEFRELNKGLFSSRRNGEINRGKKRTNQQTKEGRNGVTEEPTKEPINRIKEEGTNELTKEIKKGLTDERIKELMNVPVTNRQPTGNPPVTHGSKSNPSEDNRPF